MSRGAKSCKSEATMGPSTQPLNEPELTQAAGLLARAVKHGQESLILRKYIHEPGQNKAIATSADHVMKEIGDMLGKRDRDASPGPMPSAGTDDSDWSAVTPGGSYVGNLGYAAPMSSKDMQGQAHPFENMKIPLPEGVDSVREWGQTICKMDKVKNRRLTYAEMVSMSEYDTEINDYLMFIQTKFGTKNTGKLPEKITPGVDLAVYLERVKYHGSAGNQKPMVFQRELRK